MLSIISKDYFQDLGKNVFKQGKSKKRTRKPILSVHSKSRKPNDRKEKWSNLERSKVYFIESRKYRNIQTKKHQN